MEFPKVKAVLFTGKLYKDGTHPIMIRITKNRKHLYKSVGHAVPAEAWDTETCRVYEKKPQISKKHIRTLKEEQLKTLSARYKEAVVLSNAKHINDEIEACLRQVNELTRRITLNDEPLTLELIKTRLQPQASQPENSHSLFARGQRIHDRFNRANSVSTAKRYKMVLKKLRTYMGGKDLPFSSITVEFLKDYEAYLLAENYMVNTVHNHLKTIKAIYFDALKEGAVPPSQNPFFVFKLKVDTKSKKEKLSIEEIKALENLQLEPNSLMRHVRNTFLFSFYCAGIRVSDVLLLRWSNITKDGRLEYQMEKTGKQKSIKLAPKAAAILNQYRQTHIARSSYIFPYVPADVQGRELFNQISAKTALINKYLKKIAVLAGIDKPLTTHIARHSFSDIARKQQASIYDICKLLGHSSIKVTEIYLASLDLDSQDAALQSIMNY